MILHPSPNFNERNAPVTMVVLHYTATPSCEVALKVLCDPGQRPGRVSAHYLVGLDGTVYRLVDESRRAWHAGAGSWRGVSDVNSASIGIEIQNVGFDGNGSRVPFPDAQIDAVSALCLDIVRHHGIRPENVVGHADVAPARKEDPGELFPWRRLAKAGVGLWTDGFGEPSRPATEMLSAIGYDVSCPDKAMAAFRLHWHPESFAQGCGDTLRRMAAVCALLGEE